MWLKKFWKLFWKISALAITCPNLSNSWIWTAEVQGDFWKSINSHSNQRKPQGTAENSFREKSNHSDCCSLTGSQWGDFPFFCFLIQYHSLSLCSALATAPSFHSASIDCIKSLRPDEWNNLPLCIHFLFNWWQEHRGCGQWRAKEMRQKDRSVWIPALLIMCIDCQADSNLRQSSSSPLPSTLVWPGRPQLAQNQSALRYGQPSRRWPILACKTLP